jgi:hypothetical protein
MGEFNNEFNKMIVMHENEFHLRLYDFLFGSLTDEERADEDVLRSELEIWFETLRWAEGVDGVLVWYGKYGVSPTKLVWLDDADIFAEHALSILKEEVTNYAKAANNATQR